MVLFEKNAWLGGKAAVLEQAGFRFDTGPTILTLPRVLARIFAEAGRDLADELDLIRLDPQWRCFFDDGSVLDLREDAAAVCRDLESFAPGNGAARGYRDFLDVSEQLHRISESFFFWRPVEGLGDTIDLRRNLSISTLRDVLRLRMGATVAGTVRRRISDVRVAQTVDHFIQYVGSSPYGAPAVLCAIGHMQVGEGVWYPKGGSRTVPEALARLAAVLKVDVRTDTDIRRIIVEGGTVRGVEMADGERVELAALVSNMDSVRTYHELIGGDGAAGFARGCRREPACSGVVLYLGLDRAYELLHHSFVFSRDPKEEFEWIYRRGEPAPDPTCYVAAPARTEPGVAPPGREALHVLVHTPYLRPHHDWSKMLPGYRQIILDKLARTAGLHDLESRIVGRAGADAAGHPRALPGPQRRDLRSREPRQVPWRVQARQTTAARSAGCIWPVARRIRGRACRWS